jgi:triosephosphate isomerase
MRTPFIAGNWKMNKTVDEGVAFAKEFLPLVKDVQGVDIGLSPTALGLRPLAEACQGSDVLVGSQNHHWEASGAYTGEISAPMVKAAGGAFAIVGHSERRQYFGETNETVNKRILAALEAGLQVILCIGESLEERENGVTETVCGDHLRGGLAGLTPQQMQSLTVAYEPVWAIGTGKTATPEQAQEVHAFCRGLLKELYGDEIADATRIQYGGSVKPANVKELMAQPDVDGALVGGASLEAESFAQIVTFQG